MLLQFSVIPKKYNKKKKINYKIASKTLTRQDKYTVTAGTLGYSSLSQK